MLLLMLPPKSEDEVGKAGAKSEDEVGKAGAKSEELPKPPAAVPWPGLSPPPNSPSSKSTWPSSLPPPPSPSSSPPKRSKLGKGSTPSSERVDTLLGAAVELKAALPLPGFQSSSAATGLWSETSTELAESYAKHATCFTSERQPSRQSTRSVHDGTRAFSLVS